MGATSEMIMQKGCERTIISPMSRAGLYVRVTHSATQADLTEALHPTVELYRILC